MEHPHTAGRRRSTCQELLERASDLLESDLSEADKARFISHLEMCGDCDTFVETLKETISMLSDVPQKRLPGDLRRRLMQITQQQGEAKR